jgi:hypothetical protein
MRDRISIWESVQWPVGAFRYQSMFAALEPAPHWGKPATYGHFDAHCSDNLGCMIPSFDALAPNDDFDLADFGVCWP